MDRQIPLDESARADEDTHGSVHEVSGDVAYQRLAFVNVVFVGQPGAGDRGWVLVDTGLGGAASFVKHAASERYGEGARPTAIVLTHGHVDHVGNLRDLADEWDAPIYAHHRERPFLDGTSSYPPPDPAVSGGMAKLSVLFPRGPIDVSDRLHTLPSDGTIPGMPGWQWIETPGHTEGHVSLWRESDRTLLSGDAVVTTRQETIYGALTQTPEMHGPPAYFTPDWDAARESVRTLAALDPELLVTGHGRAFAGDAMRSALRELAVRFDDVAIPPSAKTHAR